MKYIFSQSNKILSIGLLFFLIVLGPIEAQDKIDYDLSWEKTGSVWGTSLGLLGISYWIEHQSDPITLNQINALNDSDILSFDRSAIKNFSINALKFSDLFRDVSLLAPLPLAFSENARLEAKEIFVMYTEVLALNSGLTLITKEISGRIRPYAYNSNAPLDLKLSSKTRRSFYSGHVSHVASLSFFTASIFSDLYPDSDYRYLVWTGAIITPAITGYLRYKAGRHFPTDVMIGYGVGALVGYFIPKLHKVNSFSNTSIVGANNGLGLLRQF